MVDSCTFTLLKSTTKVDRRFVMVVVGVDGQVDLEVGWGGGGVVSLRHSSLWIWF